MQPPKAIFLDLDETLKDTGNFRTSIIGTCKKIAECLPELSVDQLFSSNTTVWDAYWPEVADKWMTGLIDDKSFRIEIWRRTLQTFEVYDASLVQLALQTHKHLVRQTYRLFPDVPEFLASVKKRKLPMALITNGSSDTQRDKINTLNIEHWFDAVIIAGEVGVAKPNVGIFEMAIDELGIEKDNIWHIGNSLESDVAGAKAAGLFAVWLNRSNVPGSGKKTIEPDLEISS